MSKRGAECDCYGFDVAEPNAVPNPYAGGDRPRLRVLHLINLDAPGGAERFAVGLATHLPPARFETWMCCPRGADTVTAEEVRQANVPLVSLGRRRKWDIHRLAGLVRLIREQRFDIVHAHMFGSNLWGTLIGRLCRVPVVLAHEQTWAYEGNPLRAWLDGQVIGRLATRFIAVSSADAERMVRIEGVPPKKVVFIPNAYVPRPQGAATDLRAELGLAVETPLYGTVAVLRPQKALDVLLRAHAEVLRQLPRAHLVVAGGGECHEELVRLANELGIHASTHFLGPRLDVGSILTSLDVATMSSDFEGTPLFVCECMAAGAPVVATRVGGLPDLVEDGESGVLVPPREPAALGHAIADLLQDPPRRERLARAASERLAQFTMHAIAERFVSLYERLIAEHRSEARGESSRRAAPTTST